MDNDCDEDVDEGVLLQVYPDQKGMDMDWTTQLAVCSPRRFVVRV